MSFKNKHFEIEVQSDSFSRTIIRNYADGHVEIVTQTFEGGSRVCWGDTSVTNTFSKDDLKALTDAINVVQTLIG